MEEEADFHGFTDKDAGQLRSDVQKKLALLKPLRKESVLPGSSSTGSAPLARPMNRFLKRSSSAATTGLDANRPPVNLKMLVSPPLALKPSIATPSTANGPLRSPTEKRSSNTVSTGQDANRPPVKLKLLASPPAALKTAPSTANGTSASPKEMRTQSVDSSARPRRSIKPNPKFLDDDELVPSTKKPVVKQVTEVGELKRKRRRSEKSNVSNSEKDDKLDNVLPLSTPLPVKLPKNAPVQNGPTTAVKVESGAKATVPAPVVTTRVPPKVSPIPNGRSVPTTENEKIPEAKGGQGRTLNRFLKRSSSEASTGQELNRPTVITKPLVSPTSIIVDSSTVNGTSSSPTEMRTQSVDSSARPRRSIKPNPKFLDEDELVPNVKKPVVKQVTDVGELKRKRRKSEKSNVSNPEEAEEKLDKIVLPLPTPSPVKLPNNTPVQKINTPSASPIKVESDTITVVPAVSITVQQERVPVLNGSSMPVVKEIENEKKVEAKVQAKVEIKEVETKVDDELPVTENEVKAYGAKPIFLGTCILKATEQTNNENSHSSGIIRCGVCSRVKKYRAITEKRKRGSFLCTDCVGIVQNIFKLAMKARPFTSIVGPPVCEGACPIIFDPPEQFCQACFAKTCLKNLPMKDDVYFKVWRAIPPMSRGCVSTVPVVNAASPHVGKVAFVNENDEIVSTTGSLKMFGGMKSNGTDAASEDSNSSNDIVMNAEGDLNSARITTFSHKLGTSSNRENTIPVKNLESQLPASTDRLKETCRVNGVTKEEMLLGRQIGQERVQVDPILRPDLDDIEIFGFPVIVSGQSYPRKPLCFLCGSAGIEQLIYCSLCCEPFHPYCAGDDLLLDTYIARCNDDDKEDSSSSIGDPVSDEDTNSALVRTSVESRGESDPSRLVLKWTCRRCLSCKSCGGCIAKKEFLRCNRCQNPYHLDTCIDKQILSKIKNRSKLKKAWTCDVCLKCKSCGKVIESNRRLRTIQEVAAAESSESDSDDEEDEVDSRANVTSDQFNCLMLCLECFKQRKKGSFCPVCEVCYDDNDWDSKMMECCRCNRWIHSSCENLSDEQYHILGKLPEYIEYICRICHASSSTPLWYDAIQTQLIKECNSAVRLFEQKSLGSRRKRTSTDLKPSFVCNLFGSCSSIPEEEEIEGVALASVPDTTDITLIVQEESPEKAKQEEENRLMRRDMTRTVSYKEMMGCKVKLRDFVKYPATRQERWYALKTQGVEVLADWNSDYMKGTDPRISKTPIHSTPSKPFTPSKHISSITSALKVVIGSVTSLRAFQTSLITTIERTCENESEKVVLVTHASKAIQETFPWFEAPSPDEILEKLTQEPESSKVSHTEVLPQVDDSTNSVGHGKKQVLTTDPFKEMYWDPTDFFDDRLCSLCGDVGDFPPEQCGRLLWCGVNEWIHCNCAIWSSEVWELENGALQQVGGALNRGKTLRCKVCGQKGATVSCCHSSCKNSYHFKCAVESNCFLLENKTMFCPHHKLTQKQLDEIQDDMKVGRKVFVDLDWIQKRGIKANSQDVKIFIGSMKIDSLGRIVPISVTSKEWVNPSTTILISDSFVSHRIFWSLNDPWTKECYTFSTGINSNGFDQKIQDPGVNLVVDYRKGSAAVNRGIDAIRKFHQWISKAPKYIDENLIEWLSPCSEEFNVSITDDEESGVDVFGGMRVHAKGRSSPSSSISSLGSFTKVQVLSGSRKRTPYSLRRVPGRLTEECTESSNCTDGYTSSADSSIIETPRSSKTTRLGKRRRSSCKTRKPQRKRCKLSSKETYESPRRRSMRNLFMKETVNTEMWANKACDSKDDDSDNDSGVTEGASSTGNCDVRVNLLNRFNASFDEYGPPNESKGRIDDVESESDQIDCISLSSGVLDQGLNSSTQSEEACGKVYNATINFEVKRRNVTICHSCDAKKAWMYLFDEVSKTRRSNNLTGLVHPTFNASLNDVYMDLASSFRMLGISHRSVQYLIEQLPGVLSVVGRHKFYYSHRPYVDPNEDSVSVQQNSTGSARSEGFKGRKPFDMFGWLASRHRKVPLSCDLEESSRSQGLPLAMQFRDLKLKARKRFVVLHSEIHGRGLFARCDMEKGEMLIEYAGEMIRSSLSDPREKYYESKGIGCYMFRVKSQVIDATMKGNAARFINHSCEPNCEAKAVRILGKDHIIIFALRKIFKGEELTYDYKFEREEDKIICSCGAARCRKYMN